jgi:hypothetical protein
MNIQRNYFLVTHTELLRLEKGISIKGDFQMFLNLIQIENYIKEDKKSLEIKKFWVISIENTSEEFKNIKYNNLNEYNHASISLKKIYEIRSETIIGVYKIFTNEKNDSVNILFDSKHYNKFKELIINKVWDKDEIIKLRKEFDETFPKINSFSANLKVNKVWRMCNFDEIRHLFINKEIKSDNYKYLFLTYNPYYIRTSENSSYFIVEYDLNKLKKQGLFIPSLNIEKFYSSETPNDYLKQSGEGVFLKYKNSFLRERDNFAKKHKNININDITFDDIKTGIEYEAVIKKIKLEPGLIKNIYIDFKKIRNIKKVYEEWTIIKSLLKDK